MDLRTSQSQELGYIRYVANCQVRNLYLVAKRMPHNFSSDGLTALALVISSAIFSTYFRVEGDDVGRALALYRWIVELSAAIFIPLQIC